MSAPTLWNIDRTIEQLTETIAEMRANGEDCAEAETALKQYVEQELPKKVTGICHWLRKCRQDRETAQAEAKRYKALADAIEADEKRLKDICISVMQSRGIEKLNGCPGNALRVQGNGGSQALEVYDESLVPEEYYRYVRTLDNQAVKEALGKDEAAVPGARLLPRGYQLRVVDR